MSGTRFWSAPTGLPVARPAHKRTKSNIEPARPVIYIYWPTSRPIQLALVLAAGSVCILFLHLASSPGRPHVKVQEPSWLENSFLDALVKCEDNLEPTYPELVFPRPDGPMSDLSTRYRTLRTSTPLALAQRAPRSDALGLDRACLANAVEHGTPCPPGSHPPLKLDVVWTWANGSDPLHFRARRLAEMAEPRFVELPRGKKAGAEDRLFREHDELRHSIRSVLDNFRPWSARFRILAADFAFPACNSTEKNVRLGQIPQWLDISKRDGEIELDVIQHAEFMSNYRQTTFSSIESQFANLNTTEAFIYMNDDIFFMSPMTSWDFYTHAYGPVLRMQSDLMVPPTTRDTKKAHGEWQTLQYSNKLLGKWHRDRFGQRYRPYTTHEAKTLVKSMVEEVSITWHAELHHTGQQRFRLNPEAKDAYLPFLATHWMVERHREALLWSWVVGRIGGNDDEWGPAQSAQAWKELGGADSDRVDVRRKPRSTLLEDQLISVLDSTGDAIGRSTYAFSSRDGYPYSSLGRFGWKNWPTFQPRKGKGEPDMYSDPAARCTISRTECLGMHNSRVRGASAVFSRIAFDVPHCGDCILTSLVAASGPLGLSAFLPAPDRVWKGTKPSSPAPHLPLVADWRAANFTLAHVLEQSKAETSVRDWTVELIARYRFTIGLTPSHFAMLRNANSMKALFDRLEKKGQPDDKIQDIMMLCLNDDITIHPERADQMMREWESRKWPRKAEWEL